MVSINNFIALSICPLSRYSLSFVSIVDKDDNDSFNDDNDDTLLSSSLIVFDTNLENIPIIK